MILVIIIVILVITAGVCFMLGFIPGTDPFHKKKLIDAIKSLECSDLLLPADDFIHKIYVNLGYLTKEEMDTFKEFVKKLGTQEIKRGGQDMKWVPEKYKSSVEKHTEVGKKFLNMYVIKKDGNKLANDDKKDFKNKCKEEVTTIFNEKIESCKKTNKNNFKNKFVSLPTDIFDNVKLNRDFSKAMNDKQAKLSPYSRIRAYLKDNNKTIDEVNISELETVLPEKTKEKIQDYIEMIKNEEALLKSLKPKKKNTSIPSEEEIDEEEFTKETFMGYGGNGKLKFAPL